jgi:hypothetical protein
MRYAERFFGVGCGMQIRPRWDRTIFSSPPSPRHFDSRSRQPTVGTTKTQEGAAVITHTRLRTTLLGLWPSCFRNTNLQDVIPTRAQRSRFGLGKQPGANLHCGPLERCLRLLFCPGLWFCFELLEGSPGLLDRWDRLPRHRRRSSRVQHLVGLGVCQTHKQTARSVPRTRPE